jgi:hypothetical protein
VAQGPPPRRSARQPSAGRHGYQDGGYADGAYNDDGYQGGYQDVAPNGFYEDQYQEDQYQDAGYAGYEEGPVTGQYDVPRQQYADERDEYDEDPAPWAGQSIYPAGPGRVERRPPPARQATPGGRPGYRQDWPEDDAGEEEDWAQEAWPRDETASKGRRAAARARKSRRRLLVVGGVMVVAAVVTLGALGKLPFQHKPPKPVDSGLVTTFQPGEFRSVPNACTVVSAATISQYLPGKVAHVAQSQGSTQSQCTWTLDQRPNFRVLSVASQAYAPSLLATGNGSATFNAIDAYTEALQVLKNPPKSSKAPKAELGSAVGLGRNAFTALQVFHVGGDVTDEITVVVRDHNVVITVTMQGQQRGGGFGPVAIATLRAAALAAAHEVLAGIH